VASEAKPFASLSSGLLARKGAARPAMRPQGFGQVGNGLEDLGWNDMGFEPPKAADVPRDETHDAFGEDVVEHPRAHHPTGLTPVGSPVHEQQQELADRLYECEEDEVDETAELFEAEAETVVAEIVESPAVEAAIVEDVIAVASPKHAPMPVRRHAPRQRVAPGAKGKAAFTLRLDKDRHLKLRLACAVDGRSAQQIVTAALDQLLERMPDLDGLAAKAKSRG
jgi:hypothetical protein